jgi:hypothetical protein
VSANEGVNVSCSFSCRPIPIEGKLRTTEKQHARDRAGYDVYTIEWAQVECPLCHKRGRIGDGKVVAKDFKPYEEAP